MKQIISDHDLKHFKENVLSKYKKEDSPLMQVLQESQSLYGCVPIEMQQLIGNHFRISTARINGVVSFYSMFSLEPHGKYSIGVCLGTACYVKGGERLLDRLQEKLEIKQGETTKDGLYTLAPTRCVGSCSNAPVIMVNENIHNKVTSDDIPKILKSYK